MQKWMKTKEIHSEPTILYWPDYNGVIEQINYIVIKCMYITFIKKNLPNKLWFFVFDTIIYVKN